MQMYHCHVAPWLCWITFPRHPFGIWTTKEHRLLPVPPLHHASWTKMASEAPTLTYSFQKAEHKKRKRKNPIPLHFQKLSTRSNTLLLFLGHNWTKKPHLFAWETRKCSLIHEKFYEHLKMLLLKFTYRSLSHVLCVDFAVCQLGLAELRFPEIPFLYESLQRRISLGVRRVGGKQPPSCRSSADCVLVWGSGWVCTSSTLPAFPSASPRHRAGVDALAPWGGALCSQEPSSPGSEAAVRPRVSPSSCQPALLVGSACSPPACGLSLLPTCPLGAPPPFLPLPWGLPAPASGAGTPALWGLLTSLARVSPELCNRSLQL